MKKISVSMITLNEEANLERTLAAIADFADEIVIVDSFSTDKTHEIAKKYDAKIFLEPWTNYADKKNSSLEKCSNDWVLLLDADEVPDKELISSIIKQSENAEYPAYFVSRKTFYLGKLMNYAWQPDKKLRFVRKSANPKWVSEAIHESIEVEGAKGLLDGFLIHYSYRDIPHHFNKTIHYANISGGSSYRAGKKCKLGNLIINPLFAFFKIFVLQRGFLDGYRGLIAAFSSMTGTFLKYAILRSLETKDNK